MSDPFQALSALSDASVAAFVADTRSRAENAGVSFVFSDRPQIPYPTSSDMAVSGYFIDRPRIELGVATGKPISDWLPILVHESSHMDQWLEQDRSWSEAFCEGRETVDFIDDWINGREDLPMSIEELVRRSRDVELDCERRSVAKIQAFSLPIDIADYIRRANAYVFFYDHILKTRAWYPAGNAPYEREDVYSCAPDRFPEAGGAPAELVRAYTRAYGPSFPVRGPSP